MAISTVGGLSQGIRFDTAAEQTDSKVEKYEQTLQQLKQNLKRTEKDVELPENERQKKEQEIQAKIEEINRQKRLAELEEEQAKEERKKEQIQMQPQTAVQTEDSPEVSSANQKMEQRQEREREESVESPLMSAGQMESVVIGDTAVKQAREQQSTIQDLENRIRVLGGEIQMDQSRGGSAKAKEAERDDLEQRVNQARESTAKRLGNEHRRAEERKVEEEQQKTNYRFIQSQKDTALPNFQISI